MIRTPIPPRCCSGRTRRAETHVCGPLVGDGDTTQHDGVTVALGGRARLPDALQQLSHCPVLSLAHQPLARTHVHRKRIQLEVLEMSQVEGERTGSEIWTRSGERTGVRRKQEVRGEQEVGRGQEVRQMTGSKEREGR